MDTGETVERELKLVPVSGELLDRLAAVDRLGTFVARGRRSELQRNAFFDTASQALAHARVGFRRRLVDGQPMATWTIKGDTSLVGGVATRSEVELVLDGDTPPALALSALLDAARSRGASALADAVGDALATGALPRARPFLETETQRRIVDLSAAEHGWRVELALDRMRIVGHDYAEVEIEAELKRGDDATLEDVRAAIAALGEVRESHGSKLSRAMAYLSRSSPS